MPSVQDIQNSLQGLQNNYRDPNSGRVNWGDFYTNATQYAQQNNLDPNAIAQAAQGMAGGQDWDAGKVQQTIAQFSPKPTGLNAFGLPAANQTLTQGGYDATGRIQQTQGQVGDLYKQGLQMLQPYQQQGGQANQLQAALSGALGPEAQQQAYAQYNQSPGTQFLQKQGEQAVLRNASAAGGLGGGNTLRALQEYGTGLAQQDFANSFARLGQVADRGYGAATTGAGLQGQQAGIQSGLGQFSANIPLQQSQALAGMQFQTGRDISSNTAQTTSALANLINQQGAGMSDILGNTAQNVNALYQSALNGDAQAKEQLAQVLANLGVQAGGQYAGQPIVTGQPSNTLGQLGQIASGVGGIYQGLNYGKQGLTNYTPNSQYANYYDAPVGPAGGGMVA